MVAEGLLIKYPFIPGAASTMWSVIDKPGVEVVGQMTRG